jgi:putative ABC transport system permease protein
MTILRIFLARLRALFRGRAMDDALRREIGDHVEEATADFVRQGLGPDEARRQALVRFGGVTQAEERHRERRGFASLDRLRLDARLTLRALRRTPGFTLTVTGVSAVGVGAVTAVFALLYAIVLRPLPFAQPGQLALLSHTTHGLGRDEVGISPGLYEFYPQHVGSLAAIALFHEGSPQNVTLPTGEVVRAHMMRASHRLFAVLGVVPARGRLFTADDGKPGFMDATWAVPILLDYDFWQRECGGDSTVVGRTLMFTRTPRLVVGVLPQGFRFPDTASDVWELTEPPPAADRALDSFRWNALVRLKAGVTAATAQAEIARALPLAIGAYPDATPAQLAKLQLVPKVVSLKDVVSGGVSPILWTLLGGMTCLLLIACTNVASLIGARVEERRPEMAVRLAIGAGPRDVARLFALEAALIAVAAAVLGLVVAEALVEGVLRLTPVTLPRTADIGVGLAAALFAAVLAVLMTSFYAALASREQRRTASSGFAGGRSTATRRVGRGLREPFTTVQVALALALLISSALMVQTYRNLASRPLGFAPDELLTVEVTLPGSQASAHARLYQAVVDRVRHVPGVAEAAAGSFVPLAGGGDLFPVRAGDRAIPIKFITRGFFQAMKTPVLEGFGLGGGELITVDRPVIISQSLARRLFPGQSAIGQPIRRLTEDGSVVDMGKGGTSPFTIAGVVGDVPELSLRAGGAEAMYIPVIEPHVEPQIVPTDMTLVIRTPLAANALATDVRRAVAAADPAMAVGRIRTMNAVVDAARGSEAFVGSLLLLAAAISLLLGVVGIYGSVTQVVRRRTREIGVRLALGARPGEVIELVAAGSMRAVGAGLAVGLVIAFVTTGTLRALLFGIAPRDPVAFATATAILAAAAAAAALLAGRRAASVNPTEALRVE